MIKENCASTSLLVDYSYLSQVHGIDISSNKILSEFVAGLMNLLPLKSLPAEKLGEKLYVKIDSNSKITLTNCHVFYDANQQFNKEAWKGFEVHAVERGVRRKCERCQHAGEQLDRRVLTTLTETILERFMSKKPMDFFILVAGNPEYGGILTLCKKYGGRMLVAGFEDAAASFDKEDYLAFVDVSKLQSEMFTPCTPQSKLSNSVPTKIYEDSIGVSVNISSKEQDIMDILKEFGAQPELISFKQHRYDPKMIFAILYYKTERSATSAKSLVLLRSNK
eukprot:TRINITY_DN3199_c0_g3_i3.p1 TRINITY_DN3199_c0_g3~~TRINITY_DN3199_c0_g3_i3.p1  ORF type:complete len:318 (-),score=61.13 TRINITY_DN3199_c0_g3_i3:354-1190(-)